MAAGAVQVRSAAQLPAYFHLAVRNVDVGAQHELGHNPATRWRNISTPDHRTGGTPSLRVAGLLLIEHHRLRKAVVGDGAAAQRGISDLVAFRRQTAAATRP